MKKGITMLKDSIEGLKIPNEYVPCVCAQSDSAAPGSVCAQSDSAAPGSSVPGIFQARILEWVAIS